MSGGGEVVFDIAAGYDADMWDDTVLIRNYERAYQASRELIERRKGRAKAKLSWSLADPCRILYPADGLEYEGTIVKLTNRTAKVRLHGYNEEVEVQVCDLDVSQGQDEIDRQVEEALIEQGSDVEEEPFEGDLKVGAYCRARWSLDDVVYEGIVQTISQGRVKVRFIGYENEDTVSRDDVYKSKGEEWREVQVEDALATQPEIISEDIQKLIQENPDVFKDDMMSGIAELSLGSGPNEFKSSATNSVKPAAKTKKDKPNRPNAAAAVNKVGEDSRRRVPDDNVSGARPPKAFNLPSVKPADMFQPSPRLDLDGAGHPRLPQPPPVDPVPPGLGAGFPRLLPPPPPPQLFAQTPSSATDEYLHSMLISWYMAGYHTGFYQATTTAAATPAAASSSPPQPPLPAAAAAPNPFSSLPPVGAKASTLSSQQHRASFQSVAPQPAAADLASQKSTTNKTMKRKKT